MKLWAVASGRLLHSYAYHTGQVTSVAWMPDGRRFFTASLDKYGLAVHARAWHVLGLQHGHLACMRAAHIADLVIWAMHSCHQPAVSSDCLEPDEIQKCE